MRLDASAHPVAPVVTFGQRMPTGPRVVCSGVHDWRGRRNALCRSSRACDAPSLDELVEIVGQHVCKSTISVLGFASAVQCPLEPGMQRESQPLILT